MPQQDAGQGVGVWCAEPGYMAAGPIAACRARGVVFLKQGG
jgi:hypothetical protein